MARPALCALEFFLGALVEAESSDGAGLLRDTPPQTISTLRTVISRHCIYRLRLIRTQIAYEPCIALPSTLHACSTRGNFWCECGVLNVSDSLGHHCSISVSTGTPVTGISSCSIYSACIIRMGWWLCISILRAVMACGARSAISRVVETTASTVVVSAGGAG